MIQGWGVMLNDLERSLVCKGHIVQNILLKTFDTSGNKEYTSIHQDMTLYFSYYMFIHYFSVKII